MEKMQKVLDDGKTSPWHGLKQLDFSDIHIPLLTEDNLDGQDYQDAHEVLFAEYLNIVFPSLEGVYFVAGDANAKQWCANGEDGDRHGRPQESQQAANLISHYFSSHIASHHLESIVHFSASLNVNG